MCPPRIRSCLAGLSDQRLSRSFPSPSSNMIRGTNSGSASGSGFSGFRWTRRFHLSGALKGLTPNWWYFRLNIVHARRLYDALQKLNEAIREVENELAAMKVDHN